MTGCVVNSRPPNSSDFGYISSLNQLEGVYRNIGEVGPERNLPFYLSYIVIRDFSSVDHPSIKTIEIRVIGKGIISVKAHGEEKVVKEEIYEEGKDFKIASGRIRIKRDIGFTSEGPAGPYYEVEELGLDVLGHGKYSSASGWVGLLYAIPLLI